jgi:sugar lactone lactonase YvrE
MMYPHFTMSLSRRITLGLVACLLSVLPVSGQYLWKTFAGQAGGSGSVNGTGKAARFDSPAGVAVAGDGTVYVADPVNHLIRKITPAGVVTTLAGSPGRLGSTDGLGSQARFATPSGIAVDAAGTVYVADTNNHTIRKITPAGLVTTLAGQARIFGNADGTASQAQFSFPSALALTANGTIYVADTSNNTIRVISTAGIVSTLAGTPGTLGDTDGFGSDALFNNPVGIVVNQDGTLIYVADRNNHSIRKITPEDGVTTFAGSPGISGSTDATGSGARFRLPNGLTLAADGTLTVTDSGNHTLRRITALGIVTTLAGKAGSPGNADGKVISEQRFNTPSAITMDASGLIYVADTNNHSIRKLTTAGILTTFAGSPESFGIDDGLGSDARFHHPNSVAVDATGNVYVADSYNHTIRKISPTGEVSTLAGSPEESGSADGSGSVARFNFPYGVAVDSSGMVYVADTENHTIRKITPAGNVTTLAGSVLTSGSRDGTASIAQFNLPSSVAVDASGNVYIADTLNSTIRKITPTGTVTTLAGNPSESGDADGPGIDARFNFPSGLTVTPTGTVYVADTGNHTIRKITSTGAVTTVAGSVNNPGSTDGRGISALLNGPGSVAVDSAGTVFVADTLNQTIRKITSAGVVTTIGGQPGFSGGTDGSGAGALFSSPWGIALSSSNVLFVADYNNHRIVRGLEAPEIVVEQPALTGLVDGSATINYGSVLVGSTSVRTFTIRNTGIGALAGLAVTKDGPASSRYTVNSSTVPSSLAVGASATFTVTFAPTVQTTEIQNAFIRIVSNDDDESPFDIALTGLGISPEIAVEEPAGTDLIDGTASTAYGTIAIGSRSIKTYTLRNLGSANLTGIAVTKTGTDNAQYTITTTGMATTLAPGASTTFTVTFAPTGTLPGVRVAALRIASNDANENPFDIALTGSADIPEIAVEQPVNTNLVDGTASIAYGNLATGTVSSRTFTIKNLGTGVLTGLAVTRDGTASAQYSVDTSGMLTRLSPGTSTTFIVTFTPTGTSGARAATLRIASNDANENPFDIALTGSAYSTTADVDGDGLNDWAEFQLAALGFNWQTSSTALVTALRTNASAAGYFTTAQLQALTPGETLLVRDPATQLFTLTLGMKKSTDLQTFSPHPIAAPASVINGAGNFEFFFTSPEPKAFFKMQVE